MQISVKLKALFLLLVPLIHITAFGQGDYDPAADEEFKIFLMVMLTVFVCGVLGAAFVGALVAGLLAAAVFGLISVGILSTGIVVGVYKRSTTAGFKTVLLISFGLVCGICGAVLAVIAQYNWNIASSSVMAASLGLAGGVLGGVFLTGISLRLVRYSIGAAVARLKVR